ncbi:MAG: YHS domain-containing protein [Fimbriimonas sp.]
MIKPILTVTVFALVAASFAGEAPIKCPVTKLTIAKKSAAVGKKTVGKKTYYFCTAHCQSLFNKNPKKYAK